MRIAFLIYSGDVNKYIWHNCTEQVNRLVNYLSLSTKVITESAKGAIQKPCTLKNHQFWICPPPCTFFYAFEVPPHPSVRTFSTINTPSPPTPKHSNSILRFSFVFMMFKSFCLFFFQLKETSRLQSNCISRSSYTDILVNQMKNNIKYSVYV